LEAAGIKIKKIQNPVHAHLWSRVRFSLLPTDCIWILFLLKKRYRQRWDRIRSSGVDSGKILRFSFGSGSEVKIWEEPDPDTDHFSISAVAGVCVVIS